MYSQKFVLCVLACFVFRNKSDDYLYLYIRNLENQRLKPVFRYKISIFICVGRKRMLNGLSCCRKIVFNGQYLRFLISFPKLSLYKTLMHHSNIKIKIFSIYMTYSIYSMNHKVTPFVQSFLFLLPLFFLSWIPKKEKGMGHFHLLKMKKYYLHLPRGKIIEVILFWC